MTGTIINVIAILIGGGLGLLFGSRLPERIHQTIVAGMGLFTGAIGIQMFLKTENPLIVLGGLLIGGLLGEWWRIEDGLHALGAWLEERFNRGAPAGENGTPEGQLHSQQLFIRGFLTASLLFCIGPMAILGSIQDGLGGDFSLLAIKSVLDGFASLAFASSLGIGVLFSALPLLAYQGGISALAVQAQAAISPAMMNELTATGGVLLIGISLSSLLQIKPIRVGNFLPALAVAPLLAAAAPAIANALR